MRFLEKDLEQVIYEATDEQINCLYLSGIRKRQLLIPGYGIPDLLFFKRVSKRYIDSEEQSVNTYSVGLEITVCELKKDKIGISAFLQAVRYCKGIRSYLESRGFENFVFKIVLIGKEIDKSGSFIYLTDLIQEDVDEFNDYEFNKSLKTVDFFTYNYGFNGIEFKRECDYRSSNDKF